MSLRDQILGATSPMVEIPCTEWGCSVWVRPLSGEERDEIEIENARLAKDAEYAPGASREGLHARVVALAARDQDGKRIFTSDDVDRLRRLDARPLDRIFRVVDSLSAVSDEEIERLIEGKDRGGGSSSGSATS